MENLLLQIEVLKPGEIRKEGLSLDSKTMKNFGNRK
jgi:hypothetical protein